MFLLLFSEFLHINTPFGVLSLYMLLLLPLSICLFILSKRISFDKMSIAAYLYGILLASYIVIGMFIYARITLGIQFISIFISLVVVLNIGRFSNPLVIGNLLSIVLAICALFAISQFIYRILGFSGPLNIFENLVNYQIISNISQGIEVVYGRSTGIFTNPNVLGFFGGICFWVMVYLKRNLNAYVYKLGIIAALICLILSMSRGSMVAFIASILFYVMFNSGDFLKIKIKTLTTSSLYLFGLIIFLYFFSDYILDENVFRLLEVLYLFDGDLAGSENLYSRVLSWREIVDATYTMPFGTIIPPQLLIPFSPDNQFIYFYARGGLFLLSSIVLIFAMISYFTILSNDKNRFIMLAVIVFIIFNSLTAEVMNYEVFMLFWLILGLSLQMCRR